MYTNNTWEILVHKFFYSKIYFPDNPIFISSKTPVILLTIFYSSSTSAPCTSLVLRLLAVIHHVIVVVT